MTASCSASSALRSSGSGSVPTRASASAAGQEIARRGVAASGRAGLHRRSLSAGVDPRRLGADRVPPRRTRRGRGRRGARGDSGDERRQLGRGALEGSRRRRRSATGRRQHPVGRRAAAARAAHRGRLRHGRPPPPAHESTRALTRRSRLAWRSPNASTFPSSPPIESGRTSSSASVCSSSDEGNRLTPGLAGCSTRRYGTRRRAGRCLSRGRPLGEAGSTPAATHRVRPR